MAVEIGCGNCGKAFGVQPEWAGLAVECPFCEVAVEVPLEVAPKGVEATEPEPAPSVLKPSATDNPFAIDTGREKKSADVVPDFKIAPDFTPVPDANKEPQNNQLQKSKGSNAKKSKTQLEREKKRKSRWKTNPSAGQPTTKEPNRAKQTSEASTEEKNQPKTAAASSAPSSVPTSKPQAKKASKKTTDASSQKMTPPKQSRSESVSTGRQTPADKNPIDKSPAGNSPVKSEQAKGGQAKSDPAGQTQASQTQASGTQATPKPTPTQPAKPTKPNKLSGGKKAAGTSKETKAAGQVQKPDAPSPSDVTKPQIDVSATTQTISASDFIESPQSPVTKTTASTKPAEDAEPSSAMHPEGNLPPEDKVPPEDKGPQEADPNTETREQVFQPFAVQFPPTIWFADSLAQQVNLVVRSGVKEIEFHGQKVLVQENDTIRNLYQWSTFVISVLVLIIVLAWVTFR